jgi:hypothetical protein
MDRLVRDLKNPMHLVKRHREFSASSSGVGSRPISGSICCDVRTTLLTVSMMRAGPRSALSPDSLGCAISVSPKPLLAKLIPADTAIKARPRRFGAINDRFNCGRRS